ncbi:MAG: OmpA family protein [Daejeonella sp.]|uniref:OmpA family protein n=1 Tax=Daejeonella sp. TaxID=2805397 RepID=UPI002733C47C|nr:OmpA family protein [Daejeonella sp.]MDP3470005.1 OmpA family protein [Daejeonella sp.]
MKTHFLKLSALALSLIVTAGANAQENPERPKLFAPSSAFNTWSFGINAGILAPAVISGMNDFTNWKADIGYGATLKNQILPALGIQADFLAGKLKADNSRNWGNGLPPVSAFDSYETQVSYAASLSANLTLANIYWINRVNVIRPYMTAGYGLMGYKPTTKTKAGVETKFNAGENVKEAYLPVGLGVKFGISNAINLDLGYTMNFVDGDNLDGYRAGPQNDKFSYSRIGLEFILGSKSKTALSSYNPVAALQDDYISRNAALQASLDADRAKHAAHMEEMNRERMRFLNDSDKDGVSDYFDKCPNTPAGVQVDGAGCEIKVTTTTTVVNPVRVVVTEEDRRVVADAIRNLEFDFGKSTLRATSYPTLNRVADLLKSKDFSLKLAGHTDDVGSDAANLKLSKDRAESVKSYLVSQGVNSSRVEAIGYGESQPISTNKTAKGRQDNRRVEFTLY